MAYPEGIYDRPRQLLAVLGSFWNKIYDGKDQLLSCSYGVSQVGKQSQRDVLELIASMSRYTVPLWHKDNWFLLRLKESEKNAAALLPPRYDDAGLVFDSGILFDQRGNSPETAFPLPEGLADARLILNRFTEPSLTWFQGQDFRLTDNAIVFRADPFANSLVPTRDLYTDIGDTTAPDREALLWIFRGDFDWEHAYRQFGYALGIRMRSSRGYRDLLNALFDALVGGTARQQVEAALSAITGIPLVLEAQETVEDISMDQTHRLVITDVHVYKFAQTANVLVSIGDVVTGGGYLTDGLRIDELNMGEVPAGLDALSMGKGFLAACFYGDLVFENKDVPLEVITDDPSGMTKVTFGLGGFPADVEKFFDELHERGVAEAMQPVDECDPGDTVAIPGSPCDGIPATVLRRGTLAHLLDRRTNPIGEPGAASLPKTINPLKFLVANILRNNAFLVRIKASQLGSATLGLHHLRLLRKITPPHTAMIVVIELTAQTDSVTVDQVGETLGTMAATEPLSDTVPGSLVSDNGSVARSVVGSCQ